MTESLPDTLGPGTLADILVKKLDQSQELSSDMAHYHRSEAGTKDHSYSFLRAAIDRNLARRQEKKNRDEQSRALRTNERVGAATPAKKVVSVPGNANNRAVSAPGGATEPASAAGGAGRGKGKGGKGGSWY